MMVSETPCIIQAERLYSGILRPLIMQDSVYRSTKTVPVCFGDVGAAMLGLGWQCMGFPIMYIYIYMYIAISDPL